MDNKINLNEIRTKISEIDKELAALIEKRFNLVLQVGQYKKANNILIFDETREKAVIAKCKEQLNDNKYNDYLERIYVEIMNTCKDIQKNEIKIL